MNQAGFESGELSQPQRLCYQALMTDALRGSSPEGTGHALLGSKLAMVLMFNGSEGDQPHTLCLPDAQSAALLVSIGQAHKLGNLEGLGG